MHEFSANGKQIDRNQRVHRLGVSTPIFVEEEGESIESLLLYTDCLVAKKE